MTLNASLDDTTLLVLEGEAVVLIGTLMMLEDAGYVAVGAANIVEARRALAGHPQIAAMITDIHLRGWLDGVAFAHEARRFSPGLEILVVSGLAHPTGSDFPDRARFLEKPYTSQQITDSLDALLKSPDN
jgi:DNA-binding NtrC family response regulator